MPEENRDLEGLSDEELARRCMQRPVDDGAWEVLYNRFHGSVRGAVRRKLSWLANETEDVVQEFFKRIFLSLPDYDSSKASLRTYVSQVVASVVVDYWRHGAKLRSRTVSLGDELEILQVRAAQNPQILGAAAEHIINRLGDKAKSELMRDLLYGKAVKDVCAERGLTESQVYAARRWLRATLREINSELPNY